MKIRRDVSQAIADPTRRAILTLVTLNAMTAGHIAEQFDAARQTISKHIQILTECELLSQKQQGREIYYDCNLQKMKELNEWLQPFQQAWESRFSKLDAILQEKKGGRS